MFRYLRLSVACLVSALLSVSMAAQAPPSADTFVARANPAANYGSAPFLAVQGGATTYVQFDLSSLPERASIAKATLRLYVNSVLAPGSFDVYQVNEAWSEETLTYNNAPPLGASATGGKPIEVSASSVDHFIMVDITPLVQGWASGATPNNGIALALAGGPAGDLGSFSFDSKENHSTGHQPESGGGVSVRNGEKRWDGGAYKLVLHLKSRGQLLYMQKPRDMHGSKNQSRLYRFLRK